MRKYVTTYTIESMINKKRQELFILLLEGKITERELRERLQAYMVAFK